MNRCKLSMLIISSFISCSATDDEEDDAAAGAPRSSRRRTRTERIEQSNPSILFEELDLGGNGIPNRYLLLVMDPDFIGMDWIWWLQLGIRVSAIGASWEWKRREYADFDDFEQKPYPWRLSLHGRPVARQPWYFSPPTQLASASLRLARGGAHRAIARPLPKLASLQARHAGFFRCFSLLPSMLKLCWVP